MSSVSKEFRFFSSRQVWAGLLALVAFRLWFSAVLPLTGDEGYFVLWGDHPAGGYYDHPPMVGWWLSGLLAISRAEWVLRLPASLMPLALAWGAWWLARPAGNERAVMAAWLVLLQPVNVWNVLITTDSPVILFSLLSVLAYVAALRRLNQPRVALAWQAAAGVLLGLAFLGKYFAALLGLAYLAHAIFVRRDTGRWAGFGLLLVASLPAPIYNLWWNSGHCWNNILFNFINRQNDGGLSWQNPLLYFLSLAFLATPWLLFEMWRHRQALFRAVRCEVDDSALFWLASIPLGLFALMSLWRSVGLHWLVSFIPLLAVLAARTLPEAVLKRLFNASAIFAALQVLVLVVLVALPVSVWKKTSFGEGVVLRLNTEALVAHMADFEPDAQWAMESYASAAFMAYKANRSVAVFGRGSVYARQDDFETNWLAQCGRKILILRTSPPEARDYLPYFDHVEFSELVVNGENFYLILGEGFNYAVYHDKVLTRIRDRFYRIPAWLPQHGCEFCERYFPTI